MTEADKPENKGSRSVYWLLGAAAGIIGEMYAARHESSADKDQKRANEDALIRATKQTAIATFFIAIAGTLAFFAAIGQIIVANWQYGALHATDEKIGKQVEALNRQLTLLETASGQTDKLIAANTELATAAGRQAEASVKQADAAKQSADAILNLERPYLFAIPRPTQNVQKESADSPPDFEINTNITDLGRVPAVLLSIYRQCMVSGDLPNEARYYRRYMRGALSAIGAGLTLTMPDSCKVDPPLSAADWVDLRANKKVIVQIIFVIYEGALDFTYVYGAAHTIDPFTGRAFSIRSGSYNYERSYQGRISGGAAVPLPTLGE
jgi:hypothetical protein